MNEKTSKQTFSALGLILFTFLVVGSGLQIALGLISRHIFGSSATPDYMFWIVSFVPLYCVAFPLTCVLMKRIPKEELKDTTHLSVGKWFYFLTIAFFVMVVGNIIGSVIGVVFKNFGINTGVAIETLTTNTAPIGSVVLALLAPIFEEMIFRKFLIDRMHRFGGHVAIMTSALMFGLFHGNFAQFFYAWFLGIVFGYVYYKTGNVIYTMLMHMTINFLGGVVAPRILSGIDLTSKDPVAMVSSPSFIWLLVYEAFMYTMAIAGAVFFFTGKKKISFTEESAQLPKEDEKKVWCNPGMILFVLGCLAMFVYSLVIGFNA